LYAEKARGIRRLYELGLVRSVWEECHPRLHHRKYSTFLAPLWRTYIWHLRPDQVTWAVEVTAAPRVMKERPGR
jgi:hypothetical protein